MSRDRLARIARHYQAHGTALKERKGGSRATQEDIDITQQVKEHIIKYKCRESHYSRGKLCRSYLPPTLNINIMWENFCKDQRQKGKDTCSVSKFKTVFYKQFNLGFGNPHSDTCSTCKELELKLKATKSEEQRQAYRTQLRLHSTRAKTFHCIMITHTEGSIKVAFDMQQNQPLPKLSVGETFYARQVWFYNLTIMQHKEKQDKTDISHYTWCETEAGRGANEVASAVQHYLLALENSLRNQCKKGLKLKLYSDSCSSQNKNSIMMCVLAHFMENSKVFMELIHYFPIRGHSFMPPNRVFGRIEKEYRKKEEILSPAEYREIIAKSGKVFVWGKDWFSYDFKQKSKELLKSNLSFKMMNVRVITYSKMNGKVQCAVKTTYFTGSEECCDVLKKNIPSFKTLKQAAIFPKTNHISVEKMKDVSKLMRFFAIPHDATDFYKDVQSTHDLRCEDNDSSVRIYEEDVIVTE